MTASWAARRQTPRLTPRGLRAFGRTLPCTIGHTGLTDCKTEGDGATPRGLWHITGCLYRPDRMTQPTPWAQPIQLGELWSDDPAMPHYNQKCRAAPGSAEALRRANPLYDLILTTDWNATGTPGKGSAIFLHRWRRPGAPTAGCIALHPTQLLWLAQRMPPGTPLLI